MNWQAFLTGFLKLIPYVVAGVNVIHQNESSETKTQLAQDALGIAVQASTQVLNPADQQLAATVGQTVSGVITTVQQVHDAAKGATK